MRSSRCDDEWFVIPVLLTKGRPSGTKKIDAFDPTKGSSLRDDKWFGISLLLPFRKWLLGIRILGY